MNYPRVDTHSGYVYKEFSALYEAGVNSTTAVRVDLRSDLFADHQLLVTIVNYNDSGTTVHELATGRYDKHDGFIATDINVAGMRSDYIRDVVTTLKRMDLVEEEWFVWFTDNLLAIANGWVWTFKSPNGKYSDYSLVPSDEIINSSLPGSVWEQINVKNIPDGTRVPGIQL